MPEQKSPERAFIGRELRPDLTTDEAAATDASLSAEELRQKAADLMGAEVGSSMGALHPDGVPVEAAHVYERKAEVTWSAIDGEAVLLDLGSGFYFSLNRVGTVIWDLMDGERTLGDIHAAVCERFAVDAKTAWDDLVALVNRLAGKELARRRS